MDLETVLFDQQGAIAVITLNRPDSLNALNEQLHRDLSLCWQKVKEDDSIRVAVVTGAGRAFCAGADLKERANFAQAGKQPPRFYRNDLGSQGLPGRHKLTKPIIAAINGICVGGGHGLALDCDIRIASTNARFGDVEIRAGQVGRIDKLMYAYPEAIAMYLGLTGEQISADRAFQWGFVSHLVEPDELMPLAMKLATTIAGFPPVAVQAYKDIAKHAVSMTPAEAEAYRASARLAVLFSKHYAEAVTAFAEKRDAQFSED